ncbi:MAG: fibronectin type III domain-containing protein, partial [Patescibacteria group bacterium]
SFIPNNAFLSGSFSQSSIAPGQTANLIVTVLGNAPEGTASAIVRGSGGGMTRDAALNIFVSGGGGAPPSSGLFSIRLDVLLKNSCGQSSASAVPMGSDASLIRIPLRDPSGGLVNGGNTYGNTFVSVSFSGTYYAEVPSFANYSALNRYEFCEFFQSSASFDSFSSSQTKTITAVFGLRDGSFFGPPTSYPFSFPVVTTIPATNVGDSFATLNGEINPNNRSLLYRFEYGETQSFGNVTNFQSTASGNFSFRVQSPITGLKPGTTYYFRITGQNETGTSYGSPISFTTSGYGQGTSSSQAPAVVTKLATSIQERAASANALVNPNWSQTSVWYEYGATAVLGLRTSEQPIGSANAFLDHSFPITGLVPGIRYNVRAASRNQYGTSYGQIIQFTTLGAATPSVVVTRAPTPSERDISCVLLTPSLDGDLLPGREFSYNVLYRNGCTFALSDAALKVMLPDGVDFIATSLPPLEKTGNTLSFKLGTLGRDTQAALTVRGIIKQEVKEGDPLPFTATLTFTVSGERHSVSALLTEFAGKEKAEGNQLGAFLLGIFRNLSGRTLFEILLIAAIAFFGYLALLGRRRAYEEAGSASYGRSVSE